MNPFSQLTSPETGKHADRGTTLTNQPHELRDSLDEGCRYPRSLPLPGGHLSSHTSPEGPGRAGHADHRVSLHPPWGGITTHDVEASLQGGLRQWRERLLVRRVSRAEEA